MIISEKLYMFKAAKLRKYFGTSKKSSPTKWYTKRTKSAENQPHTPNVNRFVYRNGWITTYNLRNFAQK